MEQIDFSDMMDEIIDELEDNALLNGITITNRYPASHREVPLKTPCVDCWTERAKAYRLAFGNYTGGGNELGGILYGMRADITLGITVFVPLRQGGERCTEILSVILDYLMTSRGFCVNEICTEKIKYDSTLSAFRCDCSALFRTVASVGGSEIQYSGVSHVRREYA